MRTGLYGYKKGLAEGYISVIDTTKCKQAYNVRANYLEYNGNETRFLITNSEVNIIDTLTTKNYVGVFAIKHLLDLDNPIDYIFYPNVNYKNWSYIKKLLKEQIKYEHENSY